MGQIERRCKMLTLEEIKLFLNEDAVSPLKKKAAEGQRYYEAGVEEYSGLRRALNRFVIALFKAQLYSALIFFNKYIYK